MNIHIRNYAPEDCLILARLFYDTVHTVNARDYTPEQLEAWAPAPPDPELWNPSFLKHIEAYYLCSGSRRKNRGFWRY